MINFLFLISSFRQCFLQSWTKKIIIKLPSLLYLHYIFSFYVPPQTVNLQPVFKFDSTFPSDTPSLCYMCVCVPLCSHCILSPCWFCQFCLLAACTSFSFGTYKSHVPVPVSCHFRWWPGWCHVNDWRPWSPHTSCCSSCAPCWSWALFTTPPGSYIYTYGARRLVSDISSLFSNIDSSPDHPSVIVPFWNLYVIEQMCLTPVSVLPLCADCQLTLRLFQSVFFWFYSRVSLLNR